MCLDVPTPPSREHNAGRCGFGYACCRASMLTYAAVLCKQLQAISSEFHQNFEDMVNAKNNHKLNLDKYYMEIKKVKKMSGDLTDQLNELNELYKV